MVECHWLVCELFSTIHNPLIAGALEGVLTSLCILGVLQLFRIFRRDR